MYDGQLSTRQLTDAAQEITDTYTYDAFGLLLNRSGATENNYLYTGEQYDPNVGFYYLRARYYNPSVGRFLTMDTFPGMQFEPASLHKYLYCENRPVDRWDPSGEVTLMEVICTIAFISILAAGIVEAISIIRGAQFGYGTDNFEFSLGAGFFAALGLGIGTLEMYIQEKTPSNTNQIGAKKPSQLEDQTFRMWLIGAGIGVSLYSILNEGFRIFDSKIPLKTKGLRSIDDFTGWGTIMLGGVSVHPYCPVTIGFSRIRFAEGTVFPPTEDETSWGFSWENSTWISFGAFNAKWSQVNYK